MLFASFILLLSLSVSFQQDIIGNNAGSTNPMQGVMQNFQTMIKPGGQNPLTDVMKNFGGTTGSSTGSDDTASGSGPMKVIKNVQNMINVNGDEKSPLTEAMKNVRGTMNMGSSSTSGGSSGSNPIQEVMQNAQSIVVNGGGKSPVTGGNAMNLQNIQQTMAVSGGAMKLFGGMQEGPMGDMTKQAGSALSGASEIMKGK